MAGSPMHKGMSEDECLLVARLVKNGLPCFALYSHASDASPTEEKEVLDYFAGVFTVLDSRCEDRPLGGGGRAGGLSPHRQRDVGVARCMLSPPPPPTLPAHSSACVRNFSHVFSLQMPTLYSRALANPVMSTLLQHFLANSNVSRYFAEILLAFLVERMEDFGTADEQQASCREVG